MLTLMYVLHIVSFIYMRKMEFKRGLFGLIYELLDIKGKVITF